jgi:hypothetical protein
MLIIIEALICVLQIFRYTKNCVNLSIIATGIALYCTEFNYIKVRQIDAHANYHTTQFSIVQCQVYLFMFLSYRNHAKRKIVVIIIIILNQHKYQFPRQFRCIYRYIHKKREEMF